MIFKQVLHYFKQVYLHLCYQSNLEEENSKKLDTVLDRIAVPHGHVVIGGEAKLSPDDFERLGHSRTEVRDEVRMQFHFNKALFMEIAPDDKEKIGAILDEAKLDYLRNTLDDYAKLTEVVELSEQMRKDLLAKYESRKNDFEMDVRSYGHKIVEELKQGFNEELVRMQSLRERIEAKLIELDNTIEEAKASCSEARNALKASRPAVRRTRKITTSQKGLTP